MAVTLDQQTKALVHSADRAAEKARKLENAMRDLAGQVKAAKRK